MLGSKVLRVLFSKPKLICGHLNEKQLVNINRKAGNYKHTQSIAKINDQLHTLKTDVFQSRTELTATEWRDVRETLINSYRHINSNNVDTVILGVCNESEQLPLAKDYVHYLHSNGMQPNAATLGRLLRVYNAAYHKRGGCAQSLTSSEQNEILQIYSDIRSKHDILDSVSCENLIYGLVATSKWRDAVELLDMMRITSTPSLLAYTELAVKAFDMNDMPLGWGLLEDMIEQRKLPKCEVFISHINAIAKNLQSFPQEMEKMFSFLETHDLLITEKVVDRIVAFSKLQPGILSAAPIRLKRLGRCPHCGHHMRNISLSDADFRKLSEAFLQKVLIGNDVFQKSTPDEISHFKKFVAQTGPYDCVIDGLNVAYSMGSKKPPHLLANLLASVVKYFNSRNKHVLVLGRKHMDNWPKHIMDYVRENAAVFLANNLSHDDPFLLYATLKSGPATDFFSRDLMRTHAHLLGPELKLIFRHWQQEHQYSLVTLTESGKIIVKEPVRYLICAHKVQDNWHLPYKPIYTPHRTESFEVPEQWLCVKFQK